MISFALEQEQIIARDMVASFAADMLRPAMRSADGRGAHEPDLLDQLWSLGLVATAVEQPDPVTAAIILEELAWGDASAALAIASVANAIGFVAHGGTPEHRDWAARLAESPAFVPVTTALLEGGYGADIRTPQTRVEALPTGGFLLNGSKAMVPLAATATHFVVSAAIDDGVGCFLVPADAAGVSREPGASTLGLKALGLGDVRFDGVLLDDAARVGGAHAGIDALLAAARVASSAVLTGMSRAIFDYTTAYTKDRVAHGSPIAQKQSVAFRFADMHVEIEAMRWMTWRGADEIAAKRPSAARSALLAYTYAGEQAVWMSDEGLGLLGGHGFVRDHPVELWYRDARTLSVVEGLGGL